MPVQGLEPRFSKPKNDSKDHPSVIHRTFWKQRSPNKRLSECVYSSLLELFFKRFFGPSFSTSTQPCVNLSTFRLKRCQQKQPRVVSGPETPPEKHQQGVYVRVYIYIYVRISKRNIYIYTVYISLTLQTSNHFNPLTLTIFSECPSSCFDLHIGRALSFVSTSNPVVSRVVVIAIPSGCVDPH